jgi:hypothetical protein
MKENSCSNKLSYKGYLELICRYLSDDMHTKLTRMRILYGEITYVYKKAHRYNMNYIKVFK